MKKQDILEFLNNLRKSIREDPTQKWIGSYNGRQIILNKFFRSLFIIPLLCAEIGCYRIRVL